MTDDPRAPGPFAAATAVTPIGNDHYAATVRPGWDIAGNANGGYLLAIAGRALLAATDRPDPVTVTAHYLSPGRTGPLDIRTTVLRSGRRFSDALAVVAGSGTTVLSVLGTFGDLAEDVGDVLVDGAPPDLPEPDDCMAGRDSDRVPPPRMGTLELRLHPDDVGFATGGASGVPLVRGWFRLAGDEPMDTVTLLCALDVFPPAIFNAGLPMAWTPTVELTVHVRARPAPGWLRCRFTTRYITGGFLEEDGEVWDSRGRLVAQSRQLALGAAGLNRAVDRPGGPNGRRRSRGMLGTCASSTVPTPTPSNANPAGSRCGTTPDRRGSSRSGRG